MLKEIIHKVHDAVWLVGNPVPLGRASDVWEELRGWYLVHQYHPARPGFDPVIAVMWHSQVRYNNFSPVLVLVVSF